MYWLKWDDEKNDYVFQIGTRKGKTLAECVKYDSHWLIEYAMASTDVEEADIIWDAVSQTDPRTPAWYRFYTGIAPGPACSWKEFDQSVPRP